MTRIYVDADGCPVKDDVYRVAGRYDVPVTLVANSWMQTPNDENIELVVVGNDPDEADDWIADQVNANEIVITADIPLAARCLKKGAYVMGPKGRIYTDASVGEALAGREVATQLREHGIMTGGPAPFSQKDRSRFLQRLDDAVNACLRAT